ncbi:MAG: hypothetical protein AB7T22_05785 [Calditrichaceae bacterium]
MANFMTVFLRIILLISILLFPCFGGTGEPESNRDVVGRLIKQYFDSVDMTLPENGGEISIQADGIELMKKLFIKNQMIQYFSMKGISLSADSAEVTLFIEQLSINIVYIQNTKQFLGISDSVRRICSVEMEGWTESKKDDTRVKAIKFNNSFTDLIERDQLILVEDETYPFLKGKLASASGWTKLFEPIIVVLSVSTVIYLFFAVRS